MPLDLATQGSAINVLPESIDFVQDSVNAGGVVTRFDVFQRPETGTNNYTQRDIIRIRLPGNMSDLRQSTLQFTTSITGGGGATFTRFSKNMPVIQRFRVLFGSQVVVDVTNQNLLEYLCLQQERQDYQTSTGIILRGTGDTTQRNADSLLTNRVYCLDFSKVHKCLDKVWPLNFIQEQMTLEFTLEEANKCLESDASGGTYQLNNVEFHYSVMNMSREFNDMLRSKLQTSGGLMMPYKAWTNYVNTQLQSGTNSIQAQLPFRNLSMLGVIYCARNSANIIDITSLDKFENYLNNSTFSNARLKVDNTYYPNDKLDSVQDAYTTYLEFWAKSYYCDTYAGADWTNRFQLAQSIAQHPKELDQPLVQGVNVARAGTSIIAELELTGGSAVNQELQYFAHIYNVIKILPDGTLQWFN